MNLKNMGSIGRRAGKLNPRMREILAQELAAATGDDGVKLVADDFTACSFIAKKCVGLTPGEKAVVVADLRKD